MCALKHSARTMPPKKGNVVSTLARHVDMTKPVAPRVRAPILDISRANRMGHTEEFLVQHEPWQSTAFLPRPQSSTSNTPVR
eukprot:CAMPEP_0194064088 /NCGR_PEP_ID=MMETSP0009_2-20130614/82119_1 /TAXON_ID=210454 /ORGANISM="Grammatophora oceanica, Strain CCMP 410" /LENGTH=81 /DNA_ID=CAMNT_0038716459 /DNA_START=75 /DNA_END=320 /DNA_ORIENTATION=-